MSRTTLVLLTLLSASILMSCEEINTHLEEANQRRENQKPVIKYPPEPYYEYLDLGGHYYRLYKSKGQTLFLESDGFSPLVTEQSSSLTWSLSDESNLKERPNGDIRFPWVFWQPKFSIADKTHVRHISKFPKIGEHFYAIPEGTTGFFLVSSEPLYFDRHAVIKCNNNKHPHGNTEPDTEVFFSLKNCSGSFQKYMPHERIDQDAFPPHVVFRRLTLGKFKKPYGDFSYQHKDPEIYVRSLKDPSLYKDLEKSLGYFEEVIRKSYVGTEIPLDENNIDYPLLDEE